jgi:hypothetical protein
MERIANLELTLRRQAQKITIPEAQQREVLSPEKLRSVDYSVDFRYSWGDPERRADVRLGARQQVSITLDLPTLSETIKNREFADYSEALTKAFFADQTLLVAFGQACTDAGQEGGLLRLRLSIDASAMELHALRWELLKDPLSGLSLRVYDIVCKREL